VPKSASFYKKDALFSTDIDNQTAFNYVYDKIGNLITDNTTGAVLNIAWNIQNKITQVTNTNGAVVKTIKYAYDALGNRVKKEVTAGTVTSATYYTRDAQGNTLATYTQQTVSGTPDPLLLETMTLYGSARLGEYRPYECNSQEECSPTEQQTTANSNAVLGIYTRTRGYTHYELTNHLGNVLAVVTDRKLISTAVFYTADVLTLTDYYAFGQAITERTYNASAYRYSMNGQEKDTDIDSNHTTALYWEYDSRIGRRWNLDPMDMADISGYACFGNSPIAIVDIDGDVPELPKDGKKGDTHSENGNDYIHDGCDWVQIATLPDVIVAAKSLETEARENRDAEQRGNYPTKMAQPYIYPTLPTPDDIIPTQVSQVAKEGVLFLSSILYTVINDVVLLGSGSSASDIQPESDAVHGGEQIGHNVSVGIGMLEMFVVGPGLEGGGVVLALPTGGVSTIAIPVGAAVQVHGALVVGRTIVKMSKKKNENIMDDGLSSNLDDLKKQKEGLGNNKQDKALKKRIEKQEKAIGERNKQKRKK
jgi:RHS repeat-associated protein